MSRAFAMQPHIYGAQALHYRQGSAVANADTPPTWGPEMALDPKFPYTLTEYMKDVSRWCAATKASRERQGPLIALALSGAARVVADQLPDELLDSGAVVDLGDGLGAINRSGVKILFSMLYRKFPDNVEVLMLRSGLEFFGFTPAPGETVSIIFLRFDHMLDRANELVELGISFQFRSWMLLALLRLNPKQWSEYLKDMGHRFPRDESEYRALQAHIVREKTLETQV